MKLGKLKDFLHELDNLDANVFVVDNGTAYHIIDIELDPDTQNVYFIYQEHLTDWIKNDTIKE